MDDSRKMDDSRLMSMLEASKKSKKTEVTAKPEARSKGAEAADDASKSIEDVQNSVLSNNKGLSSGKLLLRSIKVHQDASKRLQSFTGSVLLSSLT